MNNPTIYGFCPAGCKWETVHRNEFDASKSAVPLFEEADHTYDLTNKDINLLEENPYHDITQHFKVYDGTAGYTVNAQNNIDATNWNVAIYIDVYCDGQLHKRRFVRLNTRSKYEHELDISLESIHFRDTNLCVSCKIDGETKNAANENNGDLRGLNGYDSLATISKETQNVSCHIYVKNIGYPYTNADGVTTERVEGCENTRVYSIGFSKGFFNERYTPQQIDEMFAEEQKSREEKDKEFSEELEAEKTSREEFNATLPDLKKGEGEHSISQVYPNDPAKTNQVKGVRDVAFGYNHKLNSNKGAVVAGAYHTVSQDAEDFKNADGTYKIDVKTELSSPDSTFGCGYNNIATMKYGFFSGNNNKLLGPRQSGAVFGSFNTVKGDCSIGGGLYTQILGNYGFGFGHGLLLYGNQFGVGVANEEITDGSVLFMVGNGLVDGNGYRLITSNAFTVYRNGNAKVQKDFEVGGSVIMTSPNGTKYKLSINDDGTLKTSKVQ